MAQGQRQESRWITLGLWWIGLGLALVLGLGLGGDGGLRVEAVTIPLEATPGPTLAARIHWPAGDAQTYSLNHSPARPVPAILLCHGITSTQETLVPLARALARHGIAAVTFDFGGSGRSYGRPPSAEGNQRDGEVMWDWMEKQPGFDPQRLGIGGHSMGGTTALFLALTHPTVRTTILLGIGGWASPQLPANLLFASGIYEELNDVPTMVDFLRMAAGDGAQPGETLGNFDLGTARQLFLAPGGNHGLAPYDGATQRAAIAWVQQSFGLPVSLEPVWGWLPGTGMLWTGAIAAAVTWGAAPYGRWLTRGGLWSRGLGAGLALGLGGLGWGLLLGGIQIWYQGGKPLLGRRFLIYGGLSYGLFVGAIALNALVTGSLGMAPQGLWGLPRLALTYPIAFGYHSFHLLRHGLYTPLGLGVWGAILALEVVRPGSGIGWGRQLGQRRRVRPSVEQPPPSRRGLVILLPFLLLAFGGLVVYQAQQGWGSLESLGFMGRIVGILVLLPGTAAIAIIRSSQFQTWLQRVAPESPRFYPGPTRGDFPGENGNPRDNPG